MNYAQKAIEYFRSAKSEMFKVSWPSRRDTLRYSALIIGICVVISAFFATLDYAFTSLSDSTVLSYAQRHAQQQAQTQTKNVQTIPVNPIAPENAANPTAQPAQTAQPAPTSQPINLEQAKPIETPKK